MSGADPRGWVGPVHAPPLVFGDIFLKVKNYKITASNAWKMQALKHTPYYILDISLLLNHLEICGSAYVVLGCLRLSSAFHTQHRYILAVLAHPLKDFFANLVISNH